MTDTAAPRRRVRTSLVVGVVIVVAAVVAIVVAVTRGTSCGGGSTYEFCGNTAIGQLIPESTRKPAADVSGTLLNSSSQYTLKSDLGHPVLINYFGTWCSPCNAEMPVLQADFERFSPVGLRMVGMDVKDSTQENSAAWVRQKKITYPIVWDIDARTALQLGNVPTNALPLTVLVDRHGRVAAVYTGGVASPAVRQEQLADALTKLGNET